MNAKEWSRVSGPIAEALPGFRTMKRGFVKESEWVAECFFADSSAFSKEVFYLEAFALPLFRPTEYLYFNYGFRVGGYDGVTDEVVRAVRRAQNRLATIATLDGLEKAWSNDLDVRSWEQRMYSAILRGDLDRAAQIGETIARWNPEREWEPEVIERASKIATLLRVGGRAAATDALAQHREDVRALLA
jgi:hypothetical protein